MAGLQSRASPAARLQVDAGTTRLRPRGTEPCGPADGRAGAGALRHRIRRPPRRSHSADGRRAGALLGSVSGTPHRDAGRPQGTRLDPRRLRRHRPEAGRAQRVRRAVRVHVSGGPRAGLVRAARDHGVQGCRQRAGLHPGHEGRRAIHRRQRALRSSGRPGRSHLPRRRRQCLRCCGAAGGGPLVRRAPAAPCDAVCGVRRRGAGAEGREDLRRVRARPAREGRDRREPRHGVAQRSQRDLRGGHVSGGVAEADPAGRRSAGRA